MRSLATRIAIPFAALLLTCCTAACRPAAPAASTPAAGTATTASQDTTAQARAALERLFKAWSSKDAQAAEAAIAPDRRGGEWELTDVDRVEFGPITDSPKDVPGYMAHGAGSVDGVTASGVRAFRATITYFYKPGREGVMQDGYAAGYMWFVERQPGGEWLVTDWGY